MNRNRMDKQNKKYNGPTQIRHKKKLQKNG